MNKYQSFCQKLLSGKIPHQRRFYIISDKIEDNNDSLGSKVKLISPTQSSVEKAKSEMKKENEDINISKFSDSLQTGGSSGKKKSKPKSRSKKKKSSKGVSKKRGASQNKKKMKNTQKSKKKGKNSFRWM